MSEGTPDGWFDDHSFIIREVGITEYIIEIHLAKIVEVLYGHAGELAEGRVGKDWGIILMFLHVASLVVTQKKHLALIPVWFHIRITLGSK